MRHLADHETVYAPLDEMPAQTAAAAGRTRDRRSERAPGATGLRLTRVTRTSVDNPPADGEPRRAPLPPTRVTAANSTLWRELRGDELPASGRMIAIDAVIDEAGSAALIGERLYGGDGNVEAGRTAETRDGWRERPGARRLVRIGGLIAVERRGGWTLWRVLPAGRAALRECDVSEQHGRRGHLARIASALDRDLWEVFDQVAARAVPGGEDEDSEPPLANGEAIMRGIERWRTLAGREQVAAA